MSLKKPRLSLRLLVLKLSLVQIFLHFLLVTPSFCRWSMVASSIGTTRWASFACFKCRFDRTFRLRSSPATKIYREKSKYSRSRCTAAHTIGTTECIVFRDRFYNYRNTESPDPTIVPTFIPQIQAQCPLNGDPTTRVVLDTGSGN